MNIAITGSVACGKSTVTKYLKEKGYNIIDADKIGHSVLDNECVIANIVKTFGESITTFDNKIDRKKLGKIVFNDEEKIKKLNSITHPLIEDEIKKQQNNFYKTHKIDEICILDIALIFEAKMTHLVDKIITVHSDYDTQLMRLKERNNISEEYAKEIIAKQLSSCEKKKLADFVVDNSNSIEETYKQVDEIFKKF